MSKQEFITQFVAAFVATRVANGYDLACAEGRHRDLEHPPIEDAIYLAKKIWNNYQDELTSSTL